MSVLIETTIGDLVVDLFCQQRPKTCANFLKLCKIKYYNLNQIFKIEPNYIAQCGDPTNTGRGGESINSFIYGEQGRYMEMETIPRINHTEMGLLSMVNDGNNMIASQFFITLGENLDFLDGKHSVFGLVAEGMHIVQRINEELVDDQNHPYKDIRIAHTIVLYDPFDDPPRLPTRRRSPSPGIDLIKVENKIALCDSVNEDEGKTAEEIKEEMEEKEMKAQAQILEMVGDLHYADERPPDNVLFVCKLNPVTTDEDLEVIFARFGTITCCEVIKDRRTGASLQYAFIEFETPKQCESAYLKMDNVLIDDRRIHVDFSQSVSKNYQWNRHQDETEPKQTQAHKFQADNRHKEHGEKSHRRKSRSPEREHKTQRHHKDRHHHHKTHSPKPRNERSYQDRKSVV